MPYNWDIGKFDAAAVAILAGETPQYATTVTSFATFQSLVYTVSGQDPLGLALVNGLIAVLVPLPLCYAMRQLYPNMRTTYLPAAVMLFLPLPVVILTVPMRDALSTLVFATILALVVQTVDTRSLWPSVLAVPLLGVLYLFRPELALVTVLGVAAATAVYTIDSVVQGEPALSSLVATTVPVGVAGFLLFTSRFPLQRLNRKVTYRAQGGAAYLESFHYRSWMDVALAAPGRAIYFQFAPFPLHVEQVFHLLAATQTPVVIVLAVAATLAIRHSETDRLTLVLLLTVYLGGVVGYGLIDSNFGTTIRHRVPFVFLLVVLAGPVLEEWWSRLAGVPDTAD